jgi:hypothetical protein
LWRKKPSPETTVLIRKTETGKTNPVALFVNIGYRNEMAKLKFYDGTYAAYDGTEVACDRKNAVC